jgi:hypothetical protein
MEEAMSLAIFYLALVGMTAVASLLIRPPEPRGSPWEVAGRQLGLSFDPEGGLSGETDGGLAVVASAEASGLPGQRLVRVTVDGLGTFPRGLSLRPLGKGDDNDRLLTGDRLLDTCQRFRGDEAVVLALLIAPVRRRLHDLVHSGGVRVEDDRVRLEDLWDGSDADDLEGIVRRALTIAHLLRRPPGEPQDALARGATADPNARFRLRCLDALVERWPDSEPVEIVRALVALQVSESEPALVAALGLEPAPVRRAAAVALGDVGTLAAVDPLLRSAEGLLTSRALKEAAREAVRKIQGRAGPAETGRLSLAAGTEGEGALSLAPDGGALAVADEG